MLFGCPGSKDLKQPYPDVVLCKGCGAELEVWSDEKSVLCQKCGEAHCRESGQSCVDWCSHARECVGYKIDTKTHVT